MENQNFDQGLARSFYFVAFLALIVFSLSTLSTLFSTIAISLLIWFLINALASKIQNISFFKPFLSEGFSIIISILIILLITLQVGSFIGQNIAQLGNSLEGMDTKIILFLESISQKYNIDFNLNNTKILEQLSVTTIINKIIGLFSSILGNSIQIILYVLFLLLDQKLFPNKLEALFKNKNNHNHAKEIITTISSNIKTYIYITTLVSMGTGFLTYLICTLFGIEGAALWGFLAFILNFIPTIGSIIAVLIPTLFAFITIDINLAILLIPALGTIQFLLGNILQPKLMGDRLNISQFVVIFSLVIWGMMWGTIGMFLSIPIMVILSIIFAQFESTKVLAILISANGKIIKKD